MKLRRCSVSHAYASYYLEEIPDLDLVAAALVEAKVASVAYVADGAAFWLSNGELRSETPEVRKREHEEQAELRFPDGIDGWAARGLYRALLWRFSELKVLSPLPLRYHRYVRALMEPSIVEFGKERVTLIPTLKLYGDGVFVVSYEVESTIAVRTVAELVGRHVNLFARWTERSWTPTALALLGSRIAFWDPGPDQESRKFNVGWAKLEQEAIAGTSQALQICGHEFLVSPMHESVAAVERVLEAIAAEVLTREFGSEGERDEPDVENGVDASEVGDAAQTQTAGSDPGPPIEPESDVDSDDDQPGNDGPSAKRNIANLFEEAERAIRLTLDPPRDGAHYVRRGPKRPSLNRGNYWQSRPQVVIQSFDDQPASAAEIRSRYGDELGTIMARVRKAPSNLGHELLGESLRPFDDHLLHVSRSMTLCVYASPESRDELYHRPTPEILELTERGCSFEIFDYLAMKCHQLDERASEVCSASEARAVRAALREVQSLAGNAFRAGELNAATLVAWDRLGLPTLTRQTGEKCALAAEAAVERSSDRAARFNAALTIVFGIVGTTALSDAVTKPLWKKLGFPLWEGMEGPILFAVSAAVVVGILATVSLVLRRSE
jgi:hypothetical protein